MAEPPSAMDAPVEMDPAIRRKLFVIDLAGILGIYCGIAAISEMVISMIAEQDFQLNLGVIALPIGFGLVRRTAKSLGCMTQLLGLFLLVGGLIVLVLIAAVAASWIFDDTSDMIGSWENAGQWERFALALDLSAMLAFLSLLVWTFSQLRKPGMYRLYTEQSRQRARISPFWLWPLIVVISLAELGRISQAAGHRAEIDALFPVHVSLYPYDAETGIPLTGFSVSPPPSSIDAFLDGAQMSGNPDGMFRLANGIAKGPFALTLAKVGYERVEVEINAATGEELRVKMHPAGDAEEDEEEEE